ncbi:hypothetical protein BWQ96_09752 [Gracilariopsis chorda]|uniref:Uncharacterized protein n=1 Tax=Gracilariopsis chorda TaxID=448386 RepID=A0A2V3IEN9_9FLOR|nr:hypothetical protein BWQ96_09752 [Gracilariopsis chorda]|eukprot:PXF40537.1 hypothetical protein BWQ96_09752 [Gracilariopsis chorda]
MPPRETSAADRARTFERAIKANNDIHAMIGLACMLTFGDEDFPKEPSRGVQLFERAIKQANAQRALLFLGLYFQHEGNRSERRRALPLLERAVQCWENYECIHALACFLMDEQCPKQDLLRAAQLFERSIRIKRDPDIMADLASLQLQNPVLQADKRSALRLYKEAIKKSNSPRLMHNLAVLYESGTPLLPRSFKKAAKWYQSAIDTAGDHRSKSCLALLLTSRDWDHPPQPARAAQLLEEALEQHHCEVYLLELADLYVEFPELQKTARALELFESAAKQYNSYEAIRSLLDFLAYGEQGFPVDYQRALSVLKHFRVQGGHDSFVEYTTACILWNGAFNVKRDRERAISIARPRRWFQDCTLSLMLRYGAPNLPRDRRAAKKYYKRIEEKTYFDLVHSLFISEPDDPEYDPARAEAIFRDIPISELDSGYIGWLPLSLRMGNIKLPYTGDERCFTYSFRKFGKGKDILVLNLASLLLEKTPKSVETGNEIVEMYESLMDTAVGDIATMNLSYLLWKGIAGITQNRKRAIELLDKLVQEKNNASARVLLASILAEDAGENNKQLERCSALWNSVKEDTEEEEELQKLAMLLSTTAKSVIGFQDECDCEPS